MYRALMTRRVRIGLKLLAILLIAFALGYIALFFLLRSTSFRQWAQAELSAKSGMEVRFVALTLSAPLHLVAVNVEISKPGEFHFQSGRLRITVTPFDLWLRTVHRVSAERPVLTIDLAEVRKPSGPSSATIGLRHLDVQDGSIVLKNGNAAVLDLPNINLEAQNLNLGQESGIRMHADVPWLQGEAELHLAGAPRALTGEIVVRAKTAQRTLPATLQSEMMRLRAQLNAPESQPVKATIEGKFEKLPAGAGQISGSLDTRMTVDPGWREVLFTGGAELKSISEALGPRGAKIPNGGAAADFSGSFSPATKILSVKTVAINSPFGQSTGDAVVSFADGRRISNARLLWSNLPLEALRPILPPPYNLWRIDGRARVDLDLRGPFDSIDVKGIARSDGVKIQAGEIALASANITLPFEWSSSAARIRDARVAATGLSYTAKDRWQATAERLQMTTSLNFPGKDSLKVSGTIDAAGGKFASPDGSKVGENLALRGPFEVDWNSGGSLARLHGNLNAASGEILWNKFFTDLKAHKPRLAIDGDYSRAADRLECRACGAAMDKIGAVEITGSIDRVTATPRFQLQARSTNFSPAGFFEIFVRENMNREYPFLDTLALGGATAFRVRLNGTPENLRLAGDVSLSGGELRAKAGSWELGAIGLKLPFEVGWGEVVTATDKPIAGTLTIGKIRFAGRDARLEPAAVSLFHNELRFHEPLRAAMFGGTIVLGNLRWPDVIGQPKQLSFSLETQRLQLQELTETFGWPRFSGTLTGSIPEVQSAGTTLKTNGEIQAEVFGGRLRITKLEIDNPFSALAAIRLDTTLANIDLEQLSKTFAFGRISGILEGTVADLIITDRQPAQFGADLHSVDRGKEQRISVEALNTITVLSSGQSAGALYGGLASLFDSFRYSKLGFKAILRNDRLVLRGVETRGDQEYLVVGSLLPPTVNIVSHTQTIGFSELLRRLERIQTDNPKVQ